LTAELRCVSLAGSASTVKEFFLVLAAPAKAVQKSIDTTPIPRDGVDAVATTSVTFDTKALIGRWLGMCADQHAGLCYETHGTAQQFRRFVEEAFFGVIDVEDMQLKSLPIVKEQPAPDIALSYVWGTSNAATRAKSYYTTRRANIMDRIQVGGLHIARHSMPATVGDAILLVRKLGYRYLWVDALCIVQDSSISWNLNAQKMHLVYGNALFTIFAADGNASTGLQAAKALLQPTAEHKRVDFTVTNESASDAAMAQPLSVEVLPGCRLLITRPLDTVVGESLWDTRAW
jgi:hypothetical protein